MANSSSFQTQILLAPATPSSSSSCSCSTSSRRSTRIINFLAPNLHGPSPFGEGRSVALRLPSQSRTRNWSGTAESLQLLPSPRATSQARQERRDGNGVAVEKNARRAKDALLDLIRDEERGVRTQANPKKLDEIVAAIETLAAIGSDTVTTDESLTAPWRMMWTTEKEILFLLEKAYLFGTRAGDVFQIIDVASGKLNNAIMFPPTGVFRVNATIEAASSQRMNFKFEGASLKVGRWKIPVPPFGKGWFESLYLDDEIRIAKDIRENYLICDRSPSVPVL